MARQIRLLGEDEALPLTTIYAAAAPVVPGALFTAAGTVRLRQVIVRNIATRPAELSLQIVRRGGQPGDDRSLRLADRLVLGPDGVAELIGQTPLGWELVLRGDRLYGCQETAGALTVLAYGTPG